MEVLSVLLCLTAAAVAGCGARERFRRRARAWVLSGVSQCGRVAGWRKLEEKQHGLCSEAARPSLANKTGQILSGQDFESSGVVGSGLLKSDGNHQPRSGGPRISGCGFF
ncbi:hypothetical protein K438DRAFT_1864866 [Mycena galopus ATCC 62051]|nr:hypothetical protein K438DRAFT_1864866 [Mycena galopus ATCC 62051]